MASNAVWMSRRMSAALLHRLLGPPAAKGAAAAVQLRLNASKASSSEPAVQSGQTAPAVRPYSPFKPTNTVEYCTRQGRRPTQLGNEELPVAVDVWPGVLRRGDDAHCSSPLRHGPLRPRSSAPGPRQADVIIVAGNRTTKQKWTPALQKGVRPDAGAPVGDLHGQLRQRRGTTNHYVLTRWCDGCDRIIPVDIYVPGSPTNC
uniref:Putative nadh-ubiquinone oxidoreductase nufs7/psst/20 kDa subunit n=1 Tax=Ixodes ricinus TaxID=34613 RepID=A0A090XCL9_IXORI